MDQFIIVFIDDTLIYFKTEAEHEEHVRIALQILRDSRLYTKFSKCEFWLKEFKFLAYVVSQEGIAMDSTKTDVVMDLEWSNNGSKVRSFLGLAGYYRWFVEGFSMIVALLTNLTRKEAKFEW